MQLPAEDGRLKGPPSNTATGGNAAVLPTMSTFPSEGGCGPDARNCLGIQWNPRCRCVRQRILTLLGGLTGYSEIFDRECSCTLQRFGRREFPVCALQAGTSAQLHRTRFCRSPE